MITAKKFMTNKIKRTRAAKPIVSKSRNAKSIIYELSVKAIMNIKELQEKNIAFKNDQILVTDINVSTILLKPQLKRPKLISIKIRNQTVFKGVEILLLIVGLF